MMRRFEALRTDETGAGQSVGTVAFDDADLMPGDVTVRIKHSTVDDKDGLAIRAAVVPKDSISAICCPSVYHAVADTRQIQNARLFTGLS